MRNAYTKSTIVFSNLFLYDETSPSCLRWAADGKSHVKAGDVAGSYNKSLGYWQVCVHKKGKQTTFYCHRIIWELVNGTIPVGQQVDHKDVDRSNNKISNLRVVTRKTNLRNASKSSRNTSGFTGVSRAKNAWLAQALDINGSTIQKAFSIKRLGEDVAKQLAIQEREAMLLMLNAKGAGYSATHGYIVKGLN